VTSAEIRKRFLAFFEKRGHTILPSASLVPENDPSVLFTTAGMQPLVPYLLGAVHPGGQRLANVQKCVRTQDIDEVGDATHDTFFEMLGNWSLGDYFKEEAIAWSYEFLTSKEEGLGLDPARLYVTVFAGDENAPRDEESVGIWQSLGMPKDRIYYLGADDNWWSPGANGPSGPDSEMFYDVTEEGLGDLTHDEFVQANDAQKVVEVWNDVFMEYEKSEGKVVGKLASKNVDTGAGLERLAMVMQNTNNVFATDLFAPLMDAISTLSAVSDERARRIVADHIRTAVFMIADGVVPSNTDQGYVLRRLLRRAVRFADVLEIAPNHLRELVRVVVSKYHDIYPNLTEKEAEIEQEIAAEEEKFRYTLKRGGEKFNEIEGDISGKDAFDLYQSYGFPIELTEELAKEQGKEVDVAGFEAEMKEHQTKSRSGSEQRFKGGLADASEMSVKYHTATHLLLAALRQVLGDHVEQKGSNITPERMRLDFPHPEKLTDEQKQAIEDLVNEKIAADLPVTHTDMPITEARQSGAMGVFGDRYADVVTVYTIGNPEHPFSKEICGGPHVEHTSVLGHFRITKEESVSAGVRRIKAILE
jgi:alanyl-tRNA synthetase